MAWRSMILRGQVVLARCEADGTVRGEGGRVEIRYRPNDGRAYRAAVSNLRPATDGTIFPDDHCAPAEAAAPKTAAPKKGAASASGGRPPETATGDEIIAYADGACSGNPGPAGLGVVLIDASSRRELSEYLGRGTNNVAELTAILRVAEQVGATDRPVRIFTDSSYAIGVLSKGWKAKANVELVAEVKRALGRLRNVTLVHVRGHAGIPLNERADVLARDAVDAESTRGWMMV